MAVYIGEHIRVITFCSFVHANIISLKDPRAGRIAKREKKTREA